MPLLLLPGEKHHWLVGSELYGIGTGVASTASSDQKSQFGVCPETLTCTPRGKGSLIITYDP